MMNNINLATESWNDYELVDSGNNLKLERYGSILISRPETQAIWKQSKPDIWKNASAEFRWTSGKGSWQKHKNIPDGWRISWKDIYFTVRLTSFKHTGVFPEQAANWEWLKERIDADRKPAVLNLFGYTGLASIVAAKAGARVTHVDASKQSNAWARENASLSGVAPDAIRYILDDALKFAKREVRRGNLYEGIILDPPAFGRGPKGEIWRIEESLPELLESVKRVLSDKPGAFLLLNGYAAGYAPLSFMQLIDSRFGTTAGEFGELRLKESGSNRAISEGIYVRFAR